ncbi:hypothetical protein [Streptomyces sp. NPDC057580]|uniref:hypothetical protein n=1 Tax=Streptomyces sp. NPDC057580 TaxID=3346173 RepID=UPI003687C0AA
MDRIAAEAAAAWWGERIGFISPETDGLQPALDGGRAFVAVMELGLRARAIETAPPAYSRTIAMFTEELARLISESTQSKVKLAVDYQPEGLLAEAADASGIDAARFPRKHRMMAWSDHVIAKAGYSAPWLLVWLAPGWQHPACGVQDWPESSADPVGPECGLPQWHQGGHDWAAPRP